MGGMLPIPWDAVRRYARHFGLRSRYDIDHFCRLVMAADEDFRAAIAARQEKAQPAA